MKPVLWILGVVFVLGALFAACIAAGNDEDSWAPILVSHDYCAADHEGCGGDDWGGGSDGNSGGEYEGGRSGDQGDGDGQCRNFCNITVPMPGDGGQRPESLFPVPTPGGVQKFVMSTIEAGIGLGRLFANATIDFVSSIMVGIA